MSINTSLSERLILIAQLYKENKNRLVQQVRDEIKLIQKMKYFPSQVQQKDILVIAVIWHGISSAEDTKYAPIDLLNKIFGDQIRALQNLDRIVKLIKLGILDSQSKKIDKNSKQQKVKVTIEKETLFKADISLSSRFLKKLVHNRNLSIDENNPYTTNREFMNDWFAYVDAANDLSSARFHYYLDNEPEEELYNVTVKWQNLQAKLEKTKKCFPFNSITDEYNLDHKEQMIVMYLLKETIDGSDCDVNELLQLISQDRYELIKNETYLSDNANLILNGIVEKRDGFGFRSRTEVRLCSTMLRILLDENPLNKECEIKEILRGNPFFTIVHPKQNMNDLILEESIKQTLVKSLKLYQKNVSGILAQWGISGNSETKNPGTLLLLYGPPGTGKTFCAGAVSNYLNRSLITTDISKILSAWVGESEQNVRSIFLTYDRIVKRLQEPPILLLNEADQFLTKRGEAQRSVDRMYNQMQNLFLEAFENFQGILICTTNLRGNLDPAFSRRFHLKLQFPFPKINERIKLWQLHIPKSIPGVDKIDINHLASRYELSGGQISVVIKNAATEAAGRKSHEKILKQEDLEKFCLLELNSSFDNTQKRYGFAV